MRPAGLRHNGVYRLPNACRYVATSYGSLWILEPFPRAAWPASMTGLRDFAYGLVSVRADGRLYRTILPPADCQRASPEPGERMDLDSLRRLTFQDTGWTVNDLGDTGEDAPTNEWPLEHQ